MACKIEPKWHTAHGVYPERFLQGEVFSFNFGEKNPPGPDQVVINWKEEELNNLIQRFAFPSDWGIQFPTTTSTALDAPPGYMTLYADFFWDGNFHLPMSKFVGDVFTGYGLHISRINALGLPRITHFEFIFRAQRIEPTFKIQRFLLCYLHRGFLFF
ncbi:hypothetical protein Hanom_Chr11g01054401 [Helianthus anomalus]